MTNLAQQHVFYRGTDNHIHHLLWDSVSGRVHTDDWTVRAQAPLAAGDPVTLATAGQQHVFYRGVDAQIHHILWVAARRTLYRDVWTLRAGAPAAKGDPSALETPGQQHVFYRGAGGAVCHIVWDVSAARLSFNDWTAQAGGEPAAGDPTPLATPGQLHVFYRNAGGGVSHILRDASSGAMGHDNWTRGARLPPVAGNLAALATDGQQHVFYRGTDNSIRHIFWASVSGALHHDDWTAGAHAPPAASDPAAMATAEGQQHVFCRGTGGNILHIFWDPSSRQLRSDDWTARSQAAAASDGRPATMVSGGQQHVFYRGRGGAIDHILWDPGTSSLGFDDWTLKAAAPRAAGEPATLTDYTWKILPLGDSITEGFSYPGGYRRRLFETANDRGKRITFVGSLANGPLDVKGVPFPPSHEGHSGKDIGFIAGIVKDALKLAPDVVLLMIGTNDILQNNHLDEAPTRLAGLLDEIIAAKVCVLIAVARITPQPEHDREVQAYNAQVSALVRDRAAEGAAVVLADMHTGFSLSFLGPDAIHPFQPGYEHIAAVWFDAIETILT